MVHCTVERHKLDWQWPHSGVHSIIMVNSAQPGEGGECTPFPFYSIYSTITNKVVMYALAERAGALLFSTFFYSVVKTFA